MSWATKPEHLRLHITAKRFEGLNIMARRIQFDNNEDYARIKEYGESTMAGQCKEWSVEEASNLQRIAQKSTMVDHTMSMSAARSKLCPWPVQHSDYHCVSFMSKTRTDPFQLGRIVGRLHLLMV